MPITMSVFAPSQLELFHETCIRYHRRQCSKAQELLIHRARETCTSVEMFLQGMYLSALLMPHFDETSLDAWALS